VKTFSPPTKLRRSICERVSARGRDLGLDGTPPAPWGRED